MRTVCTKLTLHHPHGVLQAIARETMTRPDNRDSEIVDLTHDSILMTEALAAAHNAPDTRQERIDALRAQIAAGEYEVDPAAIAEGIIRENPALFHK